MNFEPSPVTHDQVPEPPQLGSGNAVRLELFLDSEQMMNLLKALMVGQHSVLTLSEAAAYLRISAKSLQEAAEKREVPAILMEGKWRFPKTNLDEWMAAAAVSRLDHHGKETSDAA